MRISSQSLAQSSFMSYLCGAKKGRDGLCHQRKENSDWASNPARVCQESNAQACPPAVLGWSATIKADTVQLTYPFFMAVDVVKGYQLADLLKRASYLTMLVNFAYPYLKCDPGVYWYFGLTFQFYLLWAFLGSRMNWMNLLFWSCVSVIGLIAVDIYGSAASLSIYKHCFTGWFPVFALGAVLGKDNEYSIPQKSVWSEVYLFVLFLAMILLGSRWMLLWTLLPVVALAWFLCIGSLLLRTRYLSNVFRWLGRLSACIFVCHPIARSIVLYMLHPRTNNLMVNVFAYLVLTIIIALLYDRYYKWFTAKLFTT